MLQLFIYMCIDISNSQRSWIWMRMKKNCLTWLLHICIASFRSTCGRENRNRLVMLSRIVPSRKAVTSHYCRSVIVVKERFASIWTQFPHVCREYVAGVGGTECQSFIILRNSENKANVGTEAQIDINKSTHYCFILMETLLLYNNSA